MIRSRVLLARTTCLFIVTLCHGFVSPAFCRDAIKIPITVDRGRTILPVTTGASPRMGIILDTGMTFDGLLVYNRKMTRYLDLDEAFEVRVPGAGGGEPAKGVMVDSSSFFIGAFEIKNQKIIVLRSDIYDGFPTDGVLGYSVFGHYAVELDYDTGTMTLHDPDEVKITDGWTTIPLYFKNRKIPWMNVSVVVADEDPVELSVYIDFAAGDVIELLEKDDMKFALPEKTRKAYLGTGLSGDIHGKKGTISQLLIGPYALAEVEAAFAPARIRSKQEDADGIVGGGCFQRFHVIFDYHNNRLLLKPNSAFGKR